ncbi:amidase [Pseudoroseicyclus sp. CLL3-39]|uniref:Amidase n=2 Tax=Pseudoroseicyclus tamaricis TaxID=2705421 RepID=A0A6B2JNL7_9RHOB|nr:amidase [Pseudoroseicyclus tamaricis]
MAEGSLTAVALLEDHLARIEARDGAVHAFAEVTEARARAEAEAVDRARAEGRPLGPLAGIPLGVKDLIDLEGRATRGASRVPASPAKADAKVVQRLREAGAVILGALQTYEFATVGPDESLPQPPSLNIWNLEHITGGSSSGSAAAVAAGLLRAALGTDTGGSVRSPAAYCGVVGLKPTKGRVPDGGLLPLSPSLDHVGPLAATVREAAMVLDAISAPGWRPATPSGDLLGQPLTGLRVGYARAWVAGDPDCDPAVLRALDAAASTLSLLGARITEVEMPDYALFEAAGAVILDAEALAVHRERLAEHWDLYGRAARISLMRAIGLDEEDVRAAWRAAEILGQGVTAAFEGADLLLTATTLAPASPVAAFRGGKAVWTPMRTIPFNLTGHPALSLPAGFSGGLPLAAQLIAPHGGEDILCRAGAAFELATDHALQRPVYPGSR